MPRCPFLWRPPALFCETAQGSSLASDFPQARSRKDVHDKIMRDNSPAHVSSGARYAVPVRYHNGTRCEGNLAYRGTEEADTYLAGPEQSRYLGPSPAEIREEATCQSET